MQDIFKKGWLQASLSMIPPSLDDSFKDRYSISKLSLHLMYLHLMFVGKPCLNFWCIMLGLMCNLTTAILHNNEWDLTKLFGQNQHLVPPPRWLDDLIPFGKERVLNDNIGINPQGMNDMYINNLILLTEKIEGQDNLDQCNQALLLMFDTCFCPLNPSKLIPRETMEVWNKLQSKAPLEDKNAILGWLINFC
jgi:hypothetical protein